VSVSRYFTDIGQITSESESRYFTGNRQITAESETKYFTDTRTESEAINSSQILGQVTAE
jgi:hypothetical protein